MKNSVYKYYCFYKPFNVLSQFSPEQGKKSLKDFINLEKDIYPVGRLDYDSEGLLMLTNDNMFKNILINPNAGIKKVYYVQVEGQARDEHLKALLGGMIIKAKSKEFFVRAKNVEIISEPLLTPRIPPIRFRKQIPTSWIKIEISEGKNRQIRKMTAKAGLPTLRLIRYSIDSFSIEGLEPGDITLPDENKVNKILELEFKLRIKKKQGIPH